MVFTFAIDVEQKDPGMTFEGILEVINTKRMPKHGVK
jgi:hypothetical protein